MSNINNLVQDLALARQQADEAKAHLADLMAQFQQSREYVIAKEHAEATSLIALQVDEATRKAAEEAYASNPSDKHPHPAITIAMSTTAEYSQAQAIVWAKENAPGFITLDAKKFEKHARAVADTVPIWFVIWKHKPTVRIASSLDEYIANVIATANSYNDIPF